MRNILQASVSGQRAKNNSLNCTTQRDAQGLHWPGCQASAESTARALTHVEAGESGHSLIQIRGEVSHLSLAEENVQIRPVMF